MVGRSLQNLYVAIERKGYEPVLSADVRKEYSDETKVSFECPIAKLPEIFKKSAVVEEEVVIRPVHIGKLPEGFYDAKIASGEDGLTGKVLTVLKPSTRVIQCNESDDESKRYTRRYIVPVPKLVLLFSINGNYVEETKAFALKAQTVKENSLLYNYPFSNVEIADGKLCWGSVRIPEVKKLKDIDEVNRAFFESVNNVDHFAKEKTALRYDTLSAVLNHISNEKKFPNNILCKSTGEYETMADLTRIIRSV